MGEIQVSCYGEGTMDLLGHYIVYDLLDWDRCLRVVLNA